LPYVAQTMENCRNNQHFLSRRRSQFCGLAESKSKLLLSRPEIYSKPALASSTGYTGRHTAARRVGRMSHSPVKVKFFREYE